MTIPNRFKAWSTLRQGWPILAAVFAMLGAAWLSAVHRDSAESSFAAFKYRPIASPIPAPPIPAPSEQSSLAAARHPLDDALEFVQPTIEALKNVNDYTAVF